MALAPLRGRGTIAKAARGVSDMTLPSVGCLEEASSLYGATMGSSCPNQASLPRGESPDYHECWCSVLCGSRFARHSARISEHNDAVNLWEYLIVALPQFEAPTTSSRPSEATRALNDEGAEGWEAVGMTVLTDGTVAVLLKRPLGVGNESR